MRRTLFLLVLGTALALAACDESGDTNDKTLDVNGQEDGTGTADDQIGDDANLGTDIPGTLDLVTPGACGSDLDCDGGKKCCTISGEKVCMTTCPGTTGACQSDIDCLGKKCCNVNGENVCLTTCPGTVVEECQSDNDCLNGQVCCDVDGENTCLATCPGTVEEGCQSDNDCGGGMVCCPSTSGGDNECLATCETTPSGCTADTDCPGGQKCCAATIPMMPSECKAECGGGGLGIPSCTSNDECVGGQICKDLMGMAALCISECTDDSNCNGTTCKDLGALGMSLAKVCECAQDSDCPDAALKCCTIDLLSFISVKTCLTECVDLSGLLGGLGM